MNIILKDERGNHISKKQAEASDMYWKVYYENDVLIYEESYFDGVLRALDYYNMDSINHQILLSQIFDPKYSEFNIIEHDDNFPEGLSLEKIFAYGNGDNLVGVRNTVYNALDDPIATEVYFTNENGELIIDYNRTLKQYWDEDINPDASLFECHFNASGVLQGIHFENSHIDPWGQSSFSIAPGDIQGLIEKTGMSVQLANYYMTVEAIPKF